MLSFSGGVSTRVWRLRSEQVLGGRGQVVGQREGLGLQRRPDEAGRPRWPLGSRSEEGLLAIKDFMGVRV